MANTVIGPFLNLPSGPSQPFQLAAGTYKVFVVGGAPSNDPRPAAGQLDPNALAGNAGIGTTNGSAASPQVFKTPQTFPQPDKGATQVAAQSNMAPGCDLEYASADGRWSNAAVGINGPTVNGPTVSYTVGAGTFRFQVYAPNVSVHIG